MFKKAFTMMELVVSLAIVAILALILIPLANNRMQKVDRFSYYMAYAAVQDIAANIVAQSEYEYNADNLSTSSVEDIWKNKQYVAYTPKKWDNRELRGTYSNIFGRSKISYIHMYAKLDIGSQVPDINDGCDGKSINGICYDDYIPMSSTTCQLTGSQAGGDSNSRKQMPEYCGTPPDGYQKVCLWGNKGAVSGGNSLEPYVNQPLGIWATPSVSGDAWYCFMYQPVNMCVGGTIENGVCKCPTGTTYNSAKGQCVTSGGNSDNCLSPKVKMGNFCICPNIVSIGHGTQDQDTCEITCTGNWTGTTCETCPSSVKTNCENANKTYDSTNCNCGGCASGYTDYDSNGTCHANCATGKHWDSSQKKCVCDATAPAHGTINDSCVISCTSPWSKSSDGKSCICPTSVQTNCTNANKTYDSTNCACGGCASGYTDYEKDGVCRPNCATGKHWDLSKHKCVCDASAPAHGTINDSCVISCTSPWSLSGSSCICPKSVKTNCASANKTYDSTNCACGGCASGYTDYDSNGTCHANCASNKHWDSSLGQCVCNASAPAHGSINVETCALSCGSPWSLSGSSCICPSSVQTNCASANKTYDSTNCKCGGCGSGYTDYDNDGTCRANCATGKHWDSSQKKCVCDATAPAHGTINADTCALSCTSPWSKSSDGKSCICPTSVQTNCTKANKTYNSTNCACGGCASGYTDYDSNGTCHANCGTNKEWSKSQQKCVCKSGYTDYDNDGTCHANCASNKHWDSSLGQCVCNASAPAHGSINVETCALSCGSPWSLSGSSCICPSSVQTNCASANKTYDSTNCACGGCASGYTDYEKDGVCRPNCATGKHWDLSKHKCVCDASAPAHGTINADTCALSCTSPWSKSSDGKSCICPTSVQTNCASANKTYDSTNCKCGGCPSGYTDYDNDGTCHANCASNKHWDSSKGKCVCNATAPTHGTINADTCALSCTSPWSKSGDSCICPTSVQTNCTNAHKTYNSTSCACGGCVNGYTDYEKDGVCRPNCGTNKEWSLTKHQCVCKSGYTDYDNDGTCHANCPSNKHWDSSLGRCMCNASIPDHGSINVETCELSCGSPWSLSGSSCICPSSVKTSCTSANKVYDSTNCACGGCASGYTDYEKDGVCRPNCGANKEWSLTQHKCVCKSGYTDYENNGVCYENCPSSKKWNNSQHKCTCKATAPEHGTIDPDTCELSCASPWSVDGSSCTCPASVKTNCEKANKIFNANTCSCGSCNTGFEEYNNSCVGSCTGGKQRNKSGACACPEGQEDVDGTCKDVCPSTKVRNASGVCVCANSAPAHGHINSSTCEITCDSPWTKSGNSCVCSKSAPNHGSVNLQTCQISCASPWVVSGDSCVCGKKAPAHGVLNQATCEISCSSPWSKSGDSCVCAKKAPEHGSLNASTCTIACDNPWSLSGNQCVCPKTKPDHGSLDLLTCSTSCNSPWVKSGDDCICPVSVKNTCEQAKRIFVSSTCSCGACQTTAPVNGFLDSECNPQCNNGYQKIGEQCYESCPDGKVRVGTSCQCPAGSAEFGGGCVDCASISSWNEYKKVMPPCQPACERFGMVYSASKNTCVMPPEAENLCERIKSDYNISTSSCNTTATQMVSNTSSGFKDVDPHLKLSNGLNVYIASDLVKIDTLSDSVDTRDKVGYLIYIDVNGSKGKGVLYQDVYPFYVLMTGKVVPVYNPDGTGGANSVDNLSVNIIYDSYDAAGNRTVKASQTNVDYKTGACATGMIQSASYCGSIPMDSHCADSNADCRFIVNKPMKFFGR